MLCLVAQLCLILCDPMDCSPPGSSVHWDSPGKNTGVGCHALLQEDLPNPGIKPRSPTLQVDSLPTEPPGKPKNTGVGSLSLLQGIFLTQELNWGLLHHRQILYQLSHQGSPKSKMFLGKCHIALENMWVIFQYLLILIFHIILCGKRTDRSCRILYF